MIVVSSLANAHAEAAARRPARVISVLSEEEVAPDFGLPKARHLSLHVNRESCSRSIARASDARAKEIVRFMKEWDGTGDVLIHCGRGVSRSMAAAFIILCLREPETNEADLLARLRKAAPHADPCPMMVEYADDILGRDGRMAEAICRLSPPTATITAPTAEIAVA